MNPCCAQAFALDGIATGFRIAAEGATFRCGDCGAVFRKTDGVWARYVTMEELRDIARERDDEETRH